MIKTNLLYKIIIIMLASFIIIIHVRLYQYAFDDAFIHFRVARNLIETGFPYYNANEIVKVSTSTGWTIFLAILFGGARFFKIDNFLPLIVSITNSIITLCGMFIYTKVVGLLLNRQLSYSEKLVFQIPFLAVMLPSSIGLMETPFALMMAGLGIVLLLKSKPSGFSLLALAAYIRLELLILLILAGLFLALQKQVRLYKICGYTVLGSFPLLIYDLYYFHTIMPHSIVAKSIVYSLSWLQTAANILSSYTPETPLHNNWVSLGLGLAFLFIFLIALFYVLILRKPKGHMIFWPLIIYLWSLFIICGYFLAHSMIFVWYVPLFSIPLLIVCFFSIYSDLRSRNILITSLFPVYFLVSIISLSSLLYASIYNPRGISLFEWNSRVKVYQKIGSILYEEYPNATLLSSEIGGLGFSFKGEILDAAGLASPDALEFHPMRIPEQRIDGFVGAIPPGYVREKMPDLIVSYDFNAEALLKDGVFQQYNTILIPALLPEDAFYSISKTIWGNKYLRVYIRKDLPISEKIIALSH